MQNKSHWLPALIILAMVTILLPNLSQAQPDQGSMIRTGTGEDTTNVDPGIQCGAYDDPCLGEAPDSVPKAVEPIDSDQDTVQAEVPVTTPQPAPLNIKATVNTRPVVQQRQSEPETDLDQPAVKPNNQAQVQQQQAGNQQSANARQSVTTIDDQGSGQPEKTTTNRRSRVAEAVDTMERIATRNQGIGKQVRVIAQTQNTIQEEAEQALAKAKERGRLARFFIGPDYDELKLVEERLANHRQNLVELRQLKEEINIPADQELLDKEIQAIEGVVEEVAKEVEADKQGFSLFGWLNRLLVQ